MAKAWGPLWKQPDFMKLWTGQIVSEFGSRITREGLPITAVLLLAAKPDQLGLLAAFAAAPVLVVGLFAGVWADRLHRRPILIVTDIGRALALGYIPIAALLGILQIEQLYIIAAIAGILTVFFEVASQSFLPILVSRENIVEANSKLATSSSLAEIFGPALAGILIQILTAPIAIILDCLSFLFSAGSVILIRKVESAPSLTVKRENIWREIVAGWQIILTNRLLLTLTATMATRDFFGNFFAALYVLYAIQILGISPGVLGLLIAMGGIGALLGAIFATSLTTWLGLGRTMLTTSFIGGGIYLLLPLAGGSFWITILIFAVTQLLGDICQIIYNINSVSVRQLTVSDELLGRANATANFLTGGLGAIGALLAGFLADGIGVRPTVWIAVIGLTLSGCWLLFSPVVKITKMPESTSKEILVENS